MDNKPEQLDELFKLPIGLKPVVKLDGKTMYGSDDLTRSFIDAINSTSIIGKTDVFEKLVHKKLIIPCFLTGGLVSFIFWKVFAPVHLSNVAGFFSRETKKIYILLSNNFNFLAYTSNDWLAKLVIHECTHMLSEREPNTFINDFKDILMPYYTYYLNRTFNTKVTDENVAKYISYIFKTWETDRGKDKSLKEYKNILKEIVGDKEPKKIENIVIAIYLYYQEQEKFFQYRYQLGDVLYPLYLGYKEALNIKNLSTVAIQELFCPSEVVAIASEYSKYSQKVITALKRLI